MSFLRLLYQFFIYNAVYMNKIFITVCLCMAVLTGCTKTETASPKDKKDTAPERQLIIGLIPEQNIFTQMQQYEPLAGYLSEKTGIKVKMEILTRYGNIIDNFVSLGLDGAFFGSFTYALAHAKLGVEPIARPEKTDGTSTYFGLIFVRKDSNIKTVNDMRGKIFAFVDRATTAGYLLPLAFFKENGIENYRTFFKETYFTGTHEDAIYDVLNRKADIGAAKNTIYYRLADIDKRILNELFILERSPDVPSNGMAVRKDLDVSIKIKLKEALLNLHKDPNWINVLKNLDAIKFIETTDDDYESVYKYIKEAKINFATYDYLND